MEPDGNSLAGPSPPEPPALFGSCVRSLERLRSLVPAPSLKITTAKVLSAFDRHCRDFIGLSPYCVLATADAAGRTDASPRGGPCGFVRVLDDHHLIIPELSGNRRADSLTNLLDNPFAGLMFLVPGFDDFLRVNGRAWIVDDPAVLAQAEINGTRAILGIGFQMTEAYMHCAKAAKRSALWDTRLWPDLAGLPSMARILRDHTRGTIGDGSDAAIQAILDESYAKRLFKAGW
jgi:PPOX class probable FMN-dependent enzyme